MNKERYIIPKEFCENRIKENVKRMEKKMKDKEIKELIEEGILKELKEIKNLLEKQRDIPYVLTPYYPPYPYGQWYPYYCYDRGTGYSSDSYHPYMWG